MKISDSGPINSSSGLRRKTGTAGTAAGSFEQLLGMGESGAAESSAAASDVAGIGSLDGMLAMQGMGEQEARRREAIRQGHSMLDSLEQLRSSLLAGRVPAGVIMELGSRLAQQRIGIADPKLLEIMDDIELRVAVEKAKLEKAFADRGIVI